jgi:hypothetical protein
MIEIGAGWRTLLSAPSRTRACRVENSRQKSGFFSARSAYFVCPLFDFLESRFEFGRVNIGQRLVDGGMREGVHEVRKALKEDSGRKSSKNTLHLRFTHPRIWRRNPSISLKLPVRHIVKDAPVAFRNWKQVLSLADRLARALRGSSRIESNILRFRIWCRTSIFGCIRQQPRAPFLHVV